MKRNTPVLEFCADTNGGSEAWGFRLAAPDGQTLIESAKIFQSPAKAEEGFISIIKLIATNQHTIRPRRK